MSLLKEKIELKIEEAELNTQRALSRFPPIVKWLLLLSVIGIIPSYFIAKSLANNFWLSRYAQTAPLAKPSFANPQAPKISDATVVSLGSKVYAAIAQISNPNLDLSLNDLSYQFHFFNSKKQEIYAYTDKFFLLPNQKKYLTVPRFTTQEAVTYVEFRLPPSLPWQKRLGIPGVKLTVSAPHNYYQSLPQALVVEGDFVNNSPYSLKAVHLTFLLFDFSNKIIGVSTRDEFSLQPFERRTYKQLWPKISAPNLAKVEVIVDTNTLEQSNLSVPASPAGSSSDLSRPVDER